MRPEALARRFMSYKDKMVEMWGDEYTLLDMVPVRKSDRLRYELKVKHNVCGTVYQVTTTNFFGRGTTCRKCYDLLRTKTEDVFREQVLAAVGGEYVPQTAYVKNNVKVDLLHITCGRIYRVTPVDFLSGGHRCPFCVQSSASKPEGEIYDWLTSIGIEFVYQHTFPDLKHRKKLSYDFFVPSMDLLIEYDGEQHFRPKFGMSHDEISNIRIRDDLKTAYAENNGYNLIRLSYEDDHIEELKRLMGKVQRLAARRRVERPEAGGTPVG